jgi:uncharacterized protein YkwD
MALRVLALLGALALLTAGWGVAAAAPEEGPAAAPHLRDSHQLSAEETELAEQINAARREAGLPELAIESAVAALARERADDMATRRYFGHTTPEGETILSLLPARGIDFRYAGETLQRNNYPADQTVAEAARSLLASPAHRAILLDGRFTHLGLGHAADGDLHYFAVIVIEV